MEEKIIKALNNLSLKQTDELLDEDLEMKIGYTDRRRIRKAVLGKISVPKQRKTFGIHLPYKVVAYVVAIAIIIASMPIIGFDRVYAAISRMFTHVPGVGIIEDNDTIVYMMNPIARKIHQNTLNATIANALYVNDYFAMTIFVDGKPFYDVNTEKLVFYDDLTCDDFRLYVNDSPVNYQEESAQLLRDYDGLMLSFSCISTTPSTSDLYEIEIKGFAERLSFTFTPCRDYTDIIDIGPSDTQNGISIIAITEKIGNQLVVWCYPLNTTQDTLMRYGCPQFGYYSNSYVATERNVIFANESWLMSNRLTFNMPENYETATLHIPYLSMSRSEIRDASIKLPQEYSTVECDVSVMCSIGAIRVTEITRMPDRNNADIDRVDFKIELVNNNNLISLNAFDYHVIGWELANSMTLSAEGLTEGISIWVRKDVNWFSFTISALYYQALGEYVISLQLP